jgi:hypothetical protein
MAELVNLRRARKARDRAEAGKTAEANRRKFGRSKAEREKGEAEADLARRKHEGRKIED